MSKDWALVKNGKVVNKIVADDAFIPSIANQYDKIVDLSQKQHPALGADYEDGAFFDTSLSVDKVGPNQTYQSFKRFIITNKSGKYLIRLSGNDLHIGCYKYSASWIKQTFDNLLLFHTQPHHMYVENISPLKLESDGVSQNSFFVSFDNMKQISDSLIPVAGTKS